MVQVVQVNYFAHRKRKMQVCGARGLGRSGGIMDGQSTAIGKCSGAWECCGVGEV